jgi:cytidylate kinase
MLSPTSTMLRAIPCFRMGSITISASYGARGEAVAQGVAERLGLAFLDRAIPLTVARHLRLTQESVETHDERAPSRWDQFFGAFSSVDSVSTAVGIAPVALESPDTFRSATEAVMRKVADTNGAVILGRAGMVILGGRDDVLCVRLDGPIDRRIAQAVAEGVDEATARENQQDVDGARERYASFFYKVRQDDARLYHLVIDSTALPVDACIDIIVRAAQARIGAAP